MHHWRASRVDGGGSPRCRCPGGTCRSLTDVSGRVDAGSAAAGFLRATARRRAHGGAGAAPTVVGLLPGARGGEARSAPRLPTTPAHGSDRRSRRTAARPEAPRGRQPMARGLTHAQVSMPTSRRRSFFPCPTKIEPRRRSGLGERERVLDPQPGAPQHDDQSVDAMAVAIVPGLAHDRDDLIDRRRVRRVGLTLVARGYPNTKTGRGCRRAAARQRQAAAEKTTWLPPLRAGRLRAHLYRQSAVAAQRSSSDAPAPLLVSMKAGPLSRPCVRRLTPSLPNAG